MTKIIPPNSFLNQDLSLIIDVRSPREYAESHIVGAQNFPVLMMKNISKLAHCIARILSRQRFWVLVLSVKILQNIY